MRTRMTRNEIALGVVLMLRVVLCSLGVLVLIMLLFALQTPGYPLRDPSARPGPAWLSAAAAAAYGVFLCIPCRLLSRHRVIAAVIISPYAVWALTATIDAPQTVFRHALVALPIIAQGVLSRRRWCHLANDAGNDRL